MTCTEAVHLARGNGTNGGGGGGEDVTATYLYQEQGKYGMPAAQTAPIGPRAAWPGAEHRGLVLFYSVLETIGRKS